MRWTSKTQKSNRVGDYFRALKPEEIISTSVKRGFLFWPKKIGFEWRWWEFAVWIESHKIIKTKKVTVHYFEDTEWC